MPRTSYKNARCSVLQSDGQWHRSTIQSGPFVGYNGAAYYRVQIHHPYNRHDSIWANQIRPEPNYPADYYHGPTELSTPACSNPAPPTGSSSGPLAPSAPIAQPVVPSKRPLEREQQARAPTPGAHVVQPALPNANKSPAIAEPTAKRQALSLSNIAAAGNAPPDETSGLYIYKMPAAVLLEGPAVTVKVTVEAFEKIWNLPRALLSHVSPFFRTAIQDRLGASNSASIELGGFNPTAFATFVQWMYCGAYNAQWEVPGPPIENSHIDAWILGDKVEVPAFQDLAISHIFSQYETDHRALTTSTVLRVCAKTALNAPLRLLFLDLLAQNFNNQERVRGTLEEWDVALQEHPDARLALLGSLRAQGFRVKSMDSYSAIKERPNPGRETRSTTVFAAGRSQLNMTALPKIKSGIKKEPEES